ncbi:hypothetical protein OG393_34090 (plasmid) [Streptomyces sp. NBC_01216]|uniref:hypothetical protein n=1 Tax=Streptomyces sp. NBC_01216 TaxID=2903778 RepID=UPI002E0FBFD6|nr:hypothetical protein OG393_34090 [Streptomyces sp. NBC_01216]
MEQLRLHSVGVAVGTVDRPGRQTLLERRGVTLLAMASAVLVDGQVPSFAPEPSLTDTPDNVIPFRPPTS